MDSGKVSTREDSSALHPDTAFIEFMRTAYEAGLHSICLHDLRHGAATLMLADGADMKIVQALLRHSSITITSDTYTSVLPEVAREAAAALVPRRLREVATGTAGLPTASQASDNDQRPPDQGRCRAGQEAVRKWVPWDSNPQPTG